MSESLLRPIKSVKNKLPGRGRLKLYDIAREQQADEFSCLSPDELAEKSDRFDILAAIAICCEQIDAAKELGEVQLEEDYRTVLNRLQEINRGQRSKASAKGRRIISIVR